MSRFFVPLFSSVACPAAALKLSSISTRALSDESESPIARVARLLGEMKGQLEKDAATDEKAYEQMTCWCNNGEDEKKQAIADADEKITDLQTEIEKNSAGTGELTAKIAHMKKELESMKLSLNQATALREKEAKENRQEETETIEALSMMRNALQVLGKQNAGLLQMTPAVQESLSSAVSWLSFKHEELTEMGMAGMPRLKKKVLALISMPHQDLSSPVVGGHSALPKEYAAQVLASAAASIDKQEASFAQQPESVKRAAYNGQSGEIFGVLNQMNDEFKANLKEVKAKEEASAANFDKLKSASTQAIDAGKTSLDDMEERGSSTIKALSDAKEDMIATREQRAADVKFLSELNLKCQVLDRDYAARTKGRNLELKAVGDAIGILSEDDARELMNKKMGSASFLQLQSSASTDAAARATASSGLLRTAHVLMRAYRANARASAAWRAGEERPHEQLAMIAMNVKIDGFDKVKQAITAMIADLKAQQVQEVEDKDHCGTELNNNEKETYHTEQKHGDLKDNIAVLAQTIEQLQADIVAAHDTVHNTQVDVKKAGELRKDENLDFKQEVNDQRAVQNILQKVIERLREVYKKGSLAQEEPAPPVHFQEYKQSAGASPVISLIESIVGDSKAVEKEAETTENDAQKAYESFIAESTTSIKSLKKLIEAKEDEKANSAADKGQQEAEEQSTAAKLDGLSAYAADMHAECDFLMKNFDIRQKARLQETEALQAAMASLSGMVDTF